jgi:putative FmdB family regulatory protein
MPIYEYKCEDCGYTFDKLVTHHDTDVNCTICQGDVKKLMSAFAVGGSDNSANTLPAGVGPKMCTNC